jgi:Dolichyl-phosphate-mannose-protein mannosyltransferase
LNPGLNSAATAPAVRARMGIARVVERAEALPAGLFVGGIVAVSAAARYVFASNKTAPWIFPDSLVYSELAKSFAATGHFALRGVPGKGGFGIVYPLLLAPSYAVFSDVPRAFTAMKATDCVVMSLAAVPTYLLARSLVGRWLALTAAVLAVAIPDLGYTGTIMTENAFYPVFAFWCWATVRALQSPTVRRQLLALGFLALAYFTRPQAIVLVPALVTALVLIVGLDAWARRDETLARSLVSSARQYLTIMLGLAAAAAAFAIVEIGIRGKGWRDALGAYAFLADAHYSPSAVGHWFVYHLGELDFAFALLPFAGLLLVVFAGLRPRAARELRVFAAVALSASFWLILAVSAFASTPLALRILERSDFYVAPLCMVALVACVGRGLLWSERTAAAAAAVVAVGLVGAVTYVSFLGPNNANDSFSLFVLNSLLDRHWVGLSQIQPAVVAGATVAGLIFMLTPRRFGAFLPLLALLALSLANGPVEKRIRLASDQSRSGGVQTRRDWIDHAVDTKPQVATLWTNQQTFVTLWDNEFFNRSVGKVYYFNYAPDGLPATSVNVDTRNGELIASGHRVQAKYILVDPTVVIVGKPIARDPGTGMTLYRPAPPLRLRALIQGVYLDHWSGPNVIYTAYGCHGGSLRLTLLSDRDLHPRPLKIVAKVGGKPVARFIYKPGLVPRTMTVPLTGRAGVCPVTISVPTAVPLVTTGRQDTRSLGVRFLHFAYSPKRIR